MQNVDAQGCAMLSDTIFQRISTVVWKHENVADSVLFILDSLKRDSLFVEEEKDTYLLETIAEEDTNYVAFVSSRNSVVFFFNRSVEMELFKEDGTIISPSDKTMPAETAADCMDLTVETPTTLIRTRRAYGTPDSEYLMRLIKDEQTGSSFIRVAIVKN
jgi:hypothetical protein